MSKLFTIDYALSVLSLDEQITISPTALDMQKADSSTAHLQEGDILSVYDIICAMVLPQEMMQLIVWQFIQVENLILMQRMMKNAIKAS